MSSTASGAWNDKCLMTASWAQSSLASGVPGAAAYENRSPLTEHLKTMLAISSRFIASLTSSFDADNDLTSSSWSMSLLDTSEMIEASRGDGEWTLACRQRYFGQSSDDT